MKQSDIEEFKAIGYLFVGVLAYQFDLIVIAIITWGLAAVSLLTACVMAYYERQIKELTRKLRAMK